MANIFVSYNRESEVVAGTLVNDIQELGHTVWFDQKLSGGQAWWDQILAQIRNCDVFVFVLSPESLNSTACKREFGYAADLGKSILPVMVSDGVSINLLPSALCQIQFIDYQKQDRAAALSLARALSNVPPPKPLPDPLPDVPKVPISYLGSLTEQVETASTLSHEEQSVLVSELRSSLRDSETIRDGRALLQKLRKRRDLLATIAAEIDELLANKEKTPSPPPPTPEPEPPPPPDRTEPQPPPPPEPKRRWLVWITYIVIALISIAVGWGMAVAISEFTHVGFTLAIGGWIITSLTTFVLARKFLLKKKR